MMDAKKFLETKKQVESWQRDKDRVLGSLDSLKQRLKADFGCHSIKEAKVLLETRRDLLAEKEKQYDKKAGEFGEAFGELLTDNE